MQKLNATVFIENIGREFATRRHKLIFTQDQIELLYLFRKYYSLIVNFKIVSN